MGELRAGGGRTIVEGQVVEVLLGFEGSEVDVRVASAAAALNLPGARRVGAVAVAEIDIVGRLGEDRAAVARVAVAVSMASRARRTSVSQVWRTVIVKVPRCVAEKPRTMM